MGNKNTSTILLTSAGAKIIKEILKILPKPPQQTTIAYIYTAAKARHKNKKGSDIPILEKYGFKIFYYDIESKAQTQIFKFLKNKDVIWVRGGNTFYLLKQVKKSGFAKAVKELIKKRKIYIGVSAGSYIACPTIEMSTWKDSAAERFGLKNLKAMNLVPFLLSVHYQAKFKKVIKEGVKTTKYPVKILTDNQAILIKNGKIKLVGKGKEVKI